MTRVKSIPSSSANLSILHDALAQLRELPDELIKDIPLLMVNRKGSSDESYMRTENFIGHVSPGKLYRLEWSGLIDAAEEDENTPIPEPTIPAHTVIGGTWHSEIDLTIEDANILGGNGTYFLKEGDEELVIPIAESTAENLAFYGSQLVPIGGCVKFESTRNLPVTITSVGAGYAEEYLLDPEQGGGAYLEVHDRPHFHMPLDPSAGGYLIIGKLDEQKREIVTAFKVPFGYAIHMAPWTIHADSFLLGRYLVIYSATPGFSTVIIRKSDGKLGKIRFVRP